MKLLICGAGYIAGELLKRFGEAWQVTVLEKDATLLSSLSKKFPSITRVIGGDASSPVVLEDAKIAEQDFVLAMTRDDRVNLAVSRFAREAGVKNVMSLVYLPESLPQYQALGVQTVNVTASVAGTVYHYLQDPRMRVIPVAQGRAELMEIEVSAHYNLVGQALQQVRHQHWRVVGLIRENKLLPHDTDTVLQNEDRLLILGQIDLFKDVCDLIGCGEPHFPRIYGSILVLGLPVDKTRQSGALLKESFHLIKNTKLLEMDVFHENAAAEADIQTAQGPEGLNISTRRAEGNLATAIRRWSSHRNIGIVVLPLLEKSRLNMITQPLHISFAHMLPCPLLVAKGTQPYEKILVPFNGSKLTQSALEVGIDLALQIGSAAVSVLIVREPSFLHDKTETDWVGQRLEKVRELAHVYKINIKELVRDGNPIAEITAAAQDFNLMIIGSTNKAKAFLEPHVGELLVRKSPCSTLIVTH